MGKEKKKKLGRRASVSFILISAIGKKRRGVPCLSLERGKGEREGFKQQSFDSPSTKGGVERKKSGGAASDGLR